MAVTTLRPNVTHQTGVWTRTGGSSVHGVLSDDSDATYIQRAGINSAGQDPIVGLTDLPSLPAGAKIVAVRAWVRGRSVDGSPGSGCLVLRQVGGSIGSEFVTFAGTSISVQTTAWRTTRPGGGAWTVANVDALRQRFRIETDQDAVRLMESAVEVDWNERPTVDIDPLGTVVDTSEPTVTWTYADEEDDPQEQFRVVLTQGVDVVHDSGWVFSAATEYQLPALSNGSYTVEVTVRQAWSGEGVHESLPDSDAFIQAAEAPDPPDVTVTVQTDGTVLLEIEDPTVSPDPPAEWYLVEAHDGDGIWGPVRGAEAVPVGPPADVLDREAPFGTVRTYRVRSGVEVVGLHVYSDPTVVTATAEAPGRWITDPYGDLHVKVNTVEQETEWVGRDAVHYPVGMSTAVVESDVTVRHDTLAIWSLDAVEWPVLVDMLRSRRTLLFRDRRTYMYFRWHGNRTASRFGPDTAETDSLTGQMVETARPA